MDEQTPPTPAGQPNLQPTPSVPKSNTPTPDQPSSPAPAEQTAVSAPVQIPVNDQPTPAAESAPAVTPMPEATQPAAEATVSTTEEAQLPTAPVAVPANPNTLLAEAMKDPTFNEPTHVAGAVFSPVVDGNAAPVAQVAHHRKSKTKLFVLIAGVLVILLGGSAAAYYGYYMNPSVIWKQGLSNTGTGYGKLVSYLDTQSQAQYKGLSMTGTFKVDADGSNYDGNLAFKSYGNNSTTSLKLDLGATTLGLEERGLTPVGASEPDIYLQVNGIKDADTLVGGAFGPQIDSLDGQWILIDHNLLKDLQDQVAKNEANLSTKPTLTYADLTSTLQDIGNVNQQYVFTTDKDKSVTKIVKTVGKETINGHKTEHYKVGFVPANVKAYANAVCTAFKQSKVGTYFTQQLGQTAGGLFNCTSFANSADKIKTSDTIDVWVDMQTRLIYKVRVSSTTNPSETFVEFGLDYKSGDSYPFFINAQGTDSTGPGSIAITYTINSKTNAVAVTVTGNNKENGSTTSLSGNFNFTPNNTPVQVTAPTGAKSLADVLNQLGLGQYLTQLQSLGSSLQSGSLPSNSQLSIPAQNL